MANPSNRVFAARLASREAELRELYLQLYPNEQDFQDYLQMLEAAFAQRKETLRRVDAQREANPDWYRARDLLGMLLYTQCFARTLAGVKERLPYLQETGVNYVHLMPLLASPEGRSDGGYAVSDFRTVQPELGTMEDLEALADACHEQGMSVCLDFVMNHTSEDHPWAQAARQGDAEARKRYFFYPDWTVPDQFERTVPQVFPQTAPGNFTWCPEAEQVVMTTFYPYQWDLNYANPAVFRDMTGNMLYLCNRGVDIIRLDAVPYIWKELGTNCRNLPQVHTLVRMMRLSCEIVCPGTLLLGEVVMEPAKVVPYFGSVERPECHMLYNVTTMASTWHTVATGDARLLRHQMETVFALPKAYTFLNYLRCHDDIGWGLDYDFLGKLGLNEAAHKRYLNDYFLGRVYGSLSRGELYNDDPRLMDARLCGTTASLCGVEAAREGELSTALGLVEMLHAFLLTQSGIPVLYSGDEIGQTNDYTYHKDPNKWDDSRYLHRGDFRWEDAALRTDPLTRQGRLYQHILQLEALRRECAAFSAEAECWTMEPWNDHILAIGRYYKGEKLIALFNFGRDVQTAHIHEHEDYIDLLTGRARAAKEVQLPGWSFLWLRSQFMPQGE